MAVSGAIIDYSGAAGQRNTPSTSNSPSAAVSPRWTSLNLATLTNPNGLDVEGFFELPLTLAPAVYLEDIGGYYLQPEIIGSTLNAFLINVYQPNGNDRLRSLRRSRDQRNRNPNHAEAPRLRRL